VFSFLLLVSSFLLSGEESPSLTNILKQPIPRVFGTVNVISGDWVDQEVHEKPTGSDSLAIGHSYVSSNLEEGDISDGWDFLWPSTLETYSIKPSYNTSEYGSPTQTKIYLREGGGATYVLEGEASFENLTPNLTNTGYVHISSIDNPILRDIRHIQCKKDPKKDVLYVTLLDGTVRTYTRTKKKKRIENRPSFLYYDESQYHIKREVLPSKNVHVYSYDLKDNLTEISTLSSCEKHLIQKVTITEDKGALIAESLEGKKITFGMKKLKKYGNKTIVNSIKRPGVPHRNYEYCDYSPRHDRRIDKRSWSTGRVEEAKYYTDSHDTIVDGDKVHQTSEERSFSKGRVREIKTKRFRGEDLFVRNGFLYDEKGSADYKILRVTEPDDAHTTFMFHDKRVIWLLYLGKKQERLASQHFVWNLNGELKQRILFDNTKAPIVVKEVFMNSNGFPKKEIVHGRITGKKVPAIQLKNHRYEKGGESWEEEATWDDTGHLLSRCDADGNWTYFEYDRSFISRKVVCSKKNIIHREFATYDTAGNLIKLIHDDSSHRDKDNLEGATRKTVLKIVPRLKAPCFGEPLSKNYYVWTPEGGEQLKKTENFHRDDKGRLIRHTERSYDGIKKETTFAYDELDRLIEKVLPDGSIETISYDSLTGLISEKGFSHKKITYTYDLFQRIISEKETFPDGSFFETNFDYDKSGRVTKTRDSRGRIEIIEKDLLNRVISKTHSPLRTENGFVTPVEKFSYEGQSVVATSPEGARTVTLFSSIGKPLEIKHPEGRKTTFLYDILGRELEKSDGEQTVKTTYDSNGHVVLTETFVNEELVSWQKSVYLGDACIETKTEFLRTTFAYDQFGRCVERRVIDKATGKEQVETISYDGFDRVTKRSTFAGDELFTYDMMDRILTKQRTSPKGMLLYHEKTSYDLAGRVVQISHCMEEGVWSTTTTTYGAYGLLSSIQAHDGTSSHFLYRQGVHSFIKKTTNPLGLVVEEALGANDAVTRKTIFSPLGKKLSEVRTTLTLLGRPHTIDYDIYYKDTLEETIRTSLEYDSVGRLTCVKEAVGTDEEVSSYKSYDPYGRCVEETHPSGIQIRSSYDGKGRLSRKISSDGSIDLSFSYTKNDFVRKARDHVLHTETTRSYDNFGHLLSEVQSNGLTTSYEYQNSLISKYTLPDKTTCSFSYDGDALQSVNRALLTESYSWSINKRNSSGAILETSMPFSLGSISYAYDSMGRPLSKTQRIASDTRVYDLIGRPTSRSIDTGLETFQYDDLSQLTSDNGKSRSYDSLFRLREKEGEKTLVTRRQQIISLGNKKFTYNLDGHRITDGESNLTYDALGRLISYTKEGNTVRYEYDAFSRLMKRINSTSEERFLWLGQHEIGSFDSSNNCLSFRLIAEGVGSEGGGTVAVEENGTPYACYTDLSGNIRALLSSSGEVVHTANYSSFGRLETSGLDCPWGFFSKRHDDLSGYIFFLYRLYDPETSSWITQDPLGLEGGPNLYAYVQNNPLSSFDRLGLFGEGFCDCVSSCISSLCDFASATVDFCSSCISDAGSCISDACSSACSAISDVCSSAYDALSSCCSGWGGSSSSASSSTPSVSSSPLNLSYLDSKSKSFRPDTKPSGNFVALVTRNNLSLREIKFGMNYDPCFRNKMLCYVNGMNTTVAEAFAQVDKIFFENDLILAVLLGYNESVNIISDSFESAMTAGGFPMAVVTDLKEQLIEMLDLLECRESGFSIPFHCHSEGAGIMKCIRESKEFSPEMKDGYGNCLAKGCTYGGSAWSIDTLNFWARGDIVPLLNPMNWFILIFHSECVQFVGSGFQSPLSAHAFDGPAYQEAFRSTLR
jgi:RHS repeat-associated protein